MHHFHAVPHPCQIDPPWLFLPITKPNMIHQMEQIHPNAFLIGEVETLNANMGIIIWKPHPSCIASTTVQVYPPPFNNFRCKKCSREWASRYLVENMPLVQPTLNSCPLILVYIFKKALPVPLIIWYRLFVVWDRLRVLKITSLLVLSQNTSSSVSIIRNNYHLLCWYNQVPE